MATKRKSQALDNDASSAKTPRTQAQPQPTAASEAELKTQPKPDAEASQPNSDDENESNAEDDTHTRHPGPFQKIQVLERSKDDLMLLLDNFSDKQVERYEAYRRSALNKAVIKRLVSTVLNQTVSSDLVFVVSGFGKVLVGELVEKACRWKSHQPPAQSEPLSDDQQRSLTPQERQVLAQLKGKLYLGFTCKVCSHRAHKFISRQAYTEGVVLIQCDSCSNRHLIADNLGWFRDSKVNIEDLMREQGEGVRRAVDTPVELQGVSEWLGTKAQKLGSTPNDPTDSS
ncbi:hypothetical protein H4R34_003650 [Dimargaris verticillata]|uniref:DNL-type domain-containing protein n=1 Tax=Dimargaris verticillata TaxID=2761393 RepID=A0A9W8AZM1_9FUNG|nr:hypothetical protein H4R34_003650 [Dimargaris verticillata]